MTFADLSATVGGGGATEGGGAACAGAGLACGRSGGAWGASRQRGEERGGAAEALQWPLIAGEEGRGRWHSDFGRGAKPNI